MRRSLERGPAARPEPPPSRHGPIAQLLIALSPLSSILVVYAVAQWVTAPIDVGRAGADVNRLGLPLHVAAPAAADRHLLGTVPSVWLQARLAGGPPQWYDVVAALVYVTHFVAIPLVTALMWFRWRDRFAGWVTSVVAFAVVGVTGYVVYPAAPPWLASDLGVIGTVHRISGAGWSPLHLDAVGRLVGSGQAESNPVAAMPSLHAGSALLVTLALWPVAGSLWRAALVGYVVLMGCALVYTGEHYVVDVLAGWLAAAVATAIGVHARRRSATRGDDRPGRLAPWPSPPRRSDPSSA